ncbi:hypothetical protein SAMN06265373_10216 [Shimia sagamensis]|uniref:Uncharacterized protein n=1 Tax=Shimia sagamensis TaxID=1566352 RepID=A0ABY1NIC7_9RHOB|nr:hypothetical protein SAMN06265373_10216 [Shimia sagamensis]
MAVITSTIKTTQAMMSNPFKMCFTKVKGDHLFVAENCAATT